jgi:hypothetical protein
MTPAPIRYLWASLLSPLAILSGRKPNSAAILTTFQPAAYAQSPHGVMRALSMLGATIVHLRLMGTSNNARFRAISALAERVVPQLVPGCVPDREQL